MGVSKGGLWTSTRQVELEGGAALVFEQSDAGAVSLEEPSRQVESDARAASVPRGGKPAVEEVRARRRKRTRISPGRPVSQIASRAAESRSRGRQSSMASFAVITTCTGVLAASSEVADFGRLSSFSGRTTRAICGSWPQASSASRATDSFRSSW
jgi:hypothetical protein